MFRLCDLVRRVGEQRAFGLSPIASTPMTWPCAQTWGLGLLLSVVGHVIRIPRAAKLVGLMKPWAVRRRTWSKFLVPSMRLLDARLVWCKASNSSDQLMMVSTMLENSGSSPVW